MLYLPGCIVGEFSIDQTRRKQNMTLGFMLWVLGNWSWREHSLLSSPYSPLRLRVFPNPASRPLHGIRGSCRQSWCCHWDRGIHSTPEVIGFHFHKSGCARRRHIKAMVDIEASRSKSYIDKSSRPIDKLVFYWYCCRMKFVLSVK